MLMEPKEARQKETKQGDVVLWLLKKTPEEVDEELLTQARKHNVSFKKAGEGFWFAAIAVGDSASLNTFQAIVEKAMAPAPDDMVEDWLIEVEAICIPRQQEQLDARIEMKALLERLKAYPADVVQWALKDWDEDFFPVWGKLKRKIEGKLKQRKSMLNTLRHKRRAPGSDSPAPQAAQGKNEMPKPRNREEPQITDAERAKTNAILMEFARRRKVPNKVAPARPHHWAKDCASDDPRIAQLQQARESNPVVRAARKAQGKA